MGEPSEPSEDAIDIPLTNDLREIARVAARMDEFCSERDVPGEIAYAVNLAIDELLTNTISHGYDDDDNESHRVMVLARLEDEAIVVIIVDDAAPFDPTKAQEPEMAPTLEDDDIGGLGLGLLLVNRMMDGVAYRRRAGCNVVTLTKSMKDPGAMGCRGG